MRQACCGSSAQLPGYGLREDKTKTPVRLFLSPSGKAMHLQQLLRKLEGLQCVTAVMVMVQDRSLGSSGEHWGACCKSMFFICHLSPAHRHDETPKQFINWIGNLNHSVHKGTCCTEVDPSVALGGCWKAQLEWHHEAGTGVRSTSVWNLPRPPTLGQSVAPVWPSLPGKRMADSGRAHHSAPVTLTSSSPSLGASPCRYRHGTSSWGYPATFRTRKTGWLPQASQELGPDSWDLAQLPPTTGRWGLQSAHSTFPPGVTLQQFHCTIKCVATEGWGMSSMIECLPVLQGPGFNP